MTKQTIVLDDDQTIAEAARRMQQDDIGDVLVRNDGALCGIVTDRDIVVRAIAEGRDPEEVTLGEICTHELRTVGPDDDVRDAIRIMREHTIRRVPVVEDGEPIGFLSLGDLAMERDPESVLAQISADSSDHV